MVHSYPERTTRALSLKTECTRGHSVWDLNPVFEIVPGLWNGRVRSSRECVRVGKDKTTKGSTLTRTEKRPKGPYVSVSVTRNPRPKEDSQNPKRGPHITTRRLTTRVP